MRMRRDHVHRLLVQNIGSGLERSICTDCGYVGIRALPRTNFRIEMEQRVVEKLPRLRQADKDRRGG